MKSILKQTSWLFFAQALTRIVGFFYTIFLARNLGVDNFGLFTLAFSYFVIVSSIADFGFNQFLIREVAKSKLRSSELILNIAILRLTITAITFAIFALVLYRLDPDKLRVSLVLLAVLAILPQLIALTIDGIFVALRKLQFSAVALFLSSLSTVILGTILVISGFGPIGAINALIFGQLIYLIIELVLFYKYQPLKLSSVRFSIIKNAIRGALPYGILGIMGLVYFRIDIVLLAYLRGSFETGIYGAAYRFLEAVVFIPSSLALALFPIFAKLHSISLSQIRSLYFKSIKIMFGLGILISLIYLTILPIVVKLFLPSYTLSVEVIKILALSIPFIFMHIPGVQVLLSTDKYLKQMILLSLVTLSFNFIMNMIWIPKFGVFAAAWVTVASEILTLLVFFQLLRIKVLSKL